jgi:hypothetical protein
MIACVMGTSALTAPAAAAARTKTAGFALGMHQLKGTLGEASLGVSARRRVRPLPAEQHRREQWGRKWGPLTGASIRIHLAKHA